ncbi:helix-turn-helix DNA binding domain protein [Mycobacterium phage Aegeus]|nr:helix-turn-helix DNA binding domain protein [Mycobacterium phage Baudelaire]WKW86614.1 helix-turn-helix DNA binding domain protein [Mycobacterium phage Aegeus]
MARSPAGYRTPMAEPADPALQRVARLHQAAEDAVLAFYDEIRRANRQGYGYKRLEQVIDLSRGTLQKIIDDKNPRFTVYPQINA